MRPEFGRPCDRSLRGPVLLPRLCDEDYDNDDMMLSVSTVPPIKVCMHHTVIVIIIIIFIITIIIIIIVFRF